MKAFKLIIIHLLILTGSMPLLYAQSRQRGTRRPQIPPRTSSDETQNVGEDDVLRVNTNLVTIPVSVRALNGTYLFDLRKEEFHIYEDGVEQKIDHFSSVEQPFYVVILMDTSSSTQTNLREMKEAVHAFTAQLRSRDAVLPVAFAGQVRPLLGKGTNNRTILRAAIEKAETDAGNNGTRLYDALDFAYQSLRTIPGRKAIILFTDGDDTWSTATMRTTLCSAPELDALIYPIHYGSSASTMYLQALANETSGRFYQADDLETIKQSFAAIAEELRRQYNIGYYPTTKISPRPLARRIRVDVDRQDAEALVRKTLIFRR